MYREIALYVITRGASFGGLKMPATLRFYLSTIDAQSDIVELGSLGLFRVVEARPAFNEGNIGVDEAFISLLDSVSDRLSAGRQRHETNSRRMP